jgi:serine/threonine protein kinase
VDVWSLGCILAELSSGSVLFQNDSLATLLARLEGILGAVPRWMAKQVGKRPGCGRRVATSGVLPPEQPP